MVFRGKCPGVYNSWTSCQAQVNGFSNNSYNGFDTWEEASEAYYNFLAQDNNHGQLVAQHEQHQPLATNQEQHVHNATQN